MLRVLAFQLVILPMYQSLPLRRAMLMYSPGTNLSPITYIIQLLFFCGTLYVLCKLELFSKSRSKR